MFVKYSCGCKGIPLDEDNAVILIACDDDGRDRPGDSLSWSLRNMTGADGQKEYEPLTREKQEELHTQIARQFFKADRFDDVRIALGIPREPF